MARKNTGKPPGLIVYHSLREPLDALPDDECGRLLKAMLAYSCDGTLPDTAVNQFAWILCKRMIDENQVQYKETCNKNKYSTYCREAKRAGQVPLDYDAWTAAGCLAFKDFPAYQSVSNDTERYQGMPTPTFSEIDEYCRAEGLRLDTRKFYDHYTATGWKVGKSDIVDWQALCRRWAEEDKKRAQKNGLEVDYGEDEFFNH